MAGKSALLWGYHPVAEALRARRREFHVLYMVKDRRNPRLENLAVAARQAGADVQSVDLADLTARVGHRRHQGVGAKVAGYPLSSVDTILRSAAEAGTAPFVLVLDQIVDPQNLGAMARTAQCAGLHGIILTKHRSAPPSPAASKASAGALEHMQLAYVTNLANTLKRLKSEGLWIAAADRENGQSLYDVDLTGPLALVIGGEEKGVRTLVRKQCDLTVAIPQIGPLGSLNASAASAVIMYEAFRQRRKR